MKIIKKSVTLLDLFLTSDGDLSLEEIAQLSGLNKTTARRIILSLIECGFLKQNRKRGRYSLGMRFLDYAQALKKHNPIMDVAEPYLKEVCRVIDETVSLALWDGRNAVIYQSFYPSHPLKVTSYEGTMSGLHFNSLGKAILAEMLEDELNAYLANDLVRYTPNTITDIDNLKDHLNVIRKEGVAIDDEEGFLGVRGIAATLKNDKGVVVGVLNVLGPSSRLTRERITKNIPVVKEYALKISKALGYSDKQKSSVNSHMP